MEVDVGVNYISPEITRALSASPSSREAGDSLEEKDFK